MLTDLPVIWINKHNIGTYVNVYLPICILIEHVFNFDVNFYCATDKENFLVRFKM